MPPSGNVPFASSIWKIRWCSNVVCNTVVGSTLSIKVTLLRDIWRQVLFIPVPGVEWMVREIKVRCPHHIPGGHLAERCPGRRVACPKCTQPVAARELMQSETGRATDRVPRRLRACRRGEDIETLLEPNAPDDVLDDILWQVPADWYWLSRSGTSSASPRRLDRPPDQALDTVPGHTRTTAFASAADPGRVTNDDGQSCAYAATVQLLAGLRPRPGPVEASLRGTPVLETCSEPRRGDFSVREVRSGDILGDPEHLPAGEQPGPLRVDKCSCGGQLRELSAVKPAPVLVVTVDKLAGVIARAFKTGRLEREGWPSFRLVGAEAHWLPTTGHETAIFRTNDGALFDLSGTRRTEVTTSDVEEGLRLLVLWWRGMSPPPQRFSRRPLGSSSGAHPHPVSRPSGTAHPGYSTHLSSTIGPDSNVSPSPSDQATTNTPEEEHQDHTGAPLNHNRPRSSEDFVIFYPGAARRWTRGPSPSLSGAAGVDVGVLREPRRSRIGDADGHPEGDVGQVNCRAPRHSRGGPPSPTHPARQQGTPTGRPQAEGALRTSREGQAWAVFSSLEDATAARAGASTRVAWSKATAARLNLPPEATSPRLPQAPSTVSPTAAGAPRLGRAGLQRAAAATPAGATAIRAENTETDDDDEAETGPRGATQRRRRARGGSRRRGPTGIPLTWAQVEALQPLRNARARTVRPIRPGMRGPASTLPPTNAMGYPPETVFILPNSMPMAQLALADGRPFRH
ncbi:hypothetical protein PAPYR_13300 [Paratrimastix pyriformis]|uniref:Uncharacterized protein n=1 Tax=Paratrimastix pyriformis TaxID=342808 RepID=A0ABQ8U0H3_9EUKA|nr:hypothetical protein PAPYR_13300 [Paratrimastix pyriformis]